MHTPETILLHLNLIEGLGAAVAKRLLTAIAPHDLGSIYSFSIHDFKERCAVSEQTAQQLVVGLAQKKMLARELQLLNDNAISWISCLNPNFPSLLNEIHLPPLGLYVQGTLPDVSSSLAVVGSRDANRYAQRVIDRILPPLCAQRMVIVSGGARGVDSMAHAAAIAANCPTLAVLGCGLLRVSRAENIAMFPHIMRTGGAIVSTFPLLMGAEPGHFPARNRIIAGLSKGCLVVQAAKKSGALITARFALEQGKEVFAIPGHIDDPLSAGCHNLLREGAQLAESAEDITGALPIFTSKSVQTQLCIETSTQQMIESPLEHGQGEKDRLIALCAKPIAVDDLSEALGLELFEVQAHLFELQMAGRVQQNYAGLWHI